MMFAFVLAAMIRLAPGGSHHELAQSISYVVATEEPLFIDDDDRRKTAALLVAVAYRESSFRNDAIGDNGRSYCAYQIHSSSGGTRALLDDPTACVRHAYAMLRTSMRVSRAHPVAFYARGPGWRSDKAKALSRDRMWLATKLAREVTTEGN